MVRTTIMVEERAAPFRADYRVRSMPCCGVQGHWGTTVLTLTVMLTLALIGISVLLSLAVTIIDAHQAHCGTTNQRLTLHLGIRGVGL